MRFPVYVIALLGGVGVGSASYAAPPAKPSPQEQAAIFKAAGFKYIRRQWESGCNDPSAGAPYERGAISEMRDINGDGHLEAVVTEGGSYCYGNTGTAFWLLSKQTSGAWKLIYSETGIPQFLKTKGVGGWPDISVGGPGFCFPVMRWNGKAYALHRNEYEGRRCKAG